MRVLCVASEFRGHLDFGGGGYLRLAEALRTRGHGVTWMTKGQNAAVLRARGHTVSRRTAPIAPAFAADVGPTELASLAVGATMVRDELRSERPDVCLVDRNQGVAAMVVAASGIPFAAIGSPGGHWGHDPEGVVPLAGPSPVFRDLGRRLRGELPWLTGSLDSWWVHSPGLNVTFLGRSLYQDVQTPGPSAFVGLFGEAAPPGSRRRVGVNFGHSGAPSRLLGFLRRLREGNWYPAELIDVFVGGRADLAEAAARELAAFRVRGWVPFEEAFPELRCVVSFGGAGTLWHCIDHRIPMLAIPGGAGDQRFNGARLEPLGIGRAWTERTPAGALPYPFEDDDGGLREAFRRTLEWDHGPALRRFRASGNFTHDLRSACRDVEALAGR